jgi:hypothetical protein
MQVHCIGAIALTSLAVIAGCERAPASADTEGPARSNRPDANENAGPRLLVRVAAIERTAPVGPATAPTTKQGWVPVTAVVRDSTTGGLAVFAVEDVNGATVARSRPVTLGGYRGRAVAVASGLDGAERIVVQGAGLLSDGDAVQVVP